MTNMEEHDVGLETNQIILKEAEKALIRGKRVFILVLTYEDREMFQTLGGDKYEYFFFEERQKLLTYNPHDVQLIIHPDVFKFVDEEEKSDEDREGITHQVFRAILLLYQ